MADWLLSKVLHAQLLADSCILLRTEIQRDGLKKCTLKIRILRKRREEG